MDRLVSNSTAQEIDRNSIQITGIPDVVLMEEAGIRCHDALVQRVSPHQNVVLLVGSGNNGADALVVARHAALKKTMNVKIVVFDRPRSDSCLLQFQIVQKLKVPFVDFDDPVALQWLEQADLWLDGIWGIGLRQPLSPEKAQRFGSLVELQKKLSKTVYAVDVPSGLGELTVEGQEPLTCVETFALGYPKEACYFPQFRFCSGRIVPIPLGFSFEPQSGAKLLQSEDLNAFIPRWKPADYKNSKGHVYLWAGSASMLGAAILATRSASSSGAGLATIFTDERIHGLLAASVPFAMFKPENVWEIGTSTRKSLVVGPGWGRTSDRVELLEKLLELDVPTVVDADGLFALAKLVETGWKSRRTTPFVVTPHPGEWGFFTFDRTNHFKADAQNFAKSLGAVVVYKSSVTWIVEPNGEASVWDGQNPALGVAGSGDCLAGTIGAFLARGENPYDAARAAVILHARAGEALVREKGVFSADDLPSALGLACASVFSPL